MYIQASTRQKRKIPLPDNESKKDITYIADLVLQAKETDCDVVSLLKQHITIEEVRV